MTDKSRLLRTWRQIVGHMWIQALTCIFAATLTSSSFAAQYTYDSLGRIQQVVEADGSAIQYSYDANGNVTSISRTGGTAPVAINSFSPASGAVGTPVAIHGFGFSSIAAQNTVTFNGVAASVVSASGSLLQVVVPAGAASGPISVATSAGSATSATAFTVATVTISGFTPTVGPEGTAVTVSGTGFSSVASANAISFNTTAGTVQAATGTELQAVVPTGATSGHITVTSPGGTAVSAGAFIVPPSGIAGSNIVLTGVLVPGGPGRVYTIGTANKVGVAVFDGTAGQRVTVVFTNVTMDGVYRVYAPDGSLLANGNLVNNNAVDLPALPASGTYAIYLMPGTSTGSATVRIATDAIGTIPTNGAATSLTLQAGQNARLTFSAAAGESFNLVLASLVTNPSGGSVRIKVLNSDGSTLKDCGSFNVTTTQGCRFVAGVSGTFSLQLDPFGINAPSFTTRLNLDFTGALTIGQPLSVDLAVPGRNALLTFSATAGETVALNLNSISTVPSNLSVNVQIYSSTGALVTSSGGGSNRTLNITNLASGTYSVLIVPTNAATATMVVQLAGMMGGAVPADGTSAAFTAGVPQQIGYFTFTATAGQNIGIGITNRSFNPTTVTSLTGQLKRPDGTTVDTLTCSSSFVPGCAKSFRNLPVTGTYTFVVTPGGYAAMSFTLTVSPSVVGTLTAGGPAQPINLASPGQNAVFTFTATAGQSLVLNVSSLATVPASSQMGVWVYNAANSQIATTSSNASSFGLNLNNLAGGTYTVLIGTPYTVMGTMSVQLQ